MVEVSYDCQNFGPLADPKDYWSRVRVPRLVGINSNLDLLVEPRVYF